MRPINTLWIEGFKSIKELEALELGQVNVLIGANGAGKSNFIEFFQMLSELVEGRLQHWVSGRGSADRLFSFGVQNTKQIYGQVNFGANGYAFRLEPTAEGNVRFADEQVYYEKGATKWINLASGQTESRLKAARKTGGSNNRSNYCYAAISQWRIFHFHDTSETAGVNRFGSVDDYLALHSDASNLAAFLYNMQNDDPNTYQYIRSIIQLALPFFDDFSLVPRRIGKSDDYEIRLNWKRNNSRYIFSPNQLSDGSLRYICLVVALLQPQAPTTIIIDEPEIGLHPVALGLLGGLIKSASTRMQVIVATQSVPLLNEFNPEDLIVVEFEDDTSTFRRLEPDKLTLWLEDYSLGELWEKNVLGGSP